MTDVEASTRLLHRVTEDDYSLILAELQSLLREVGERYRGQQVSVRGEETCLAFASPDDAVAAVVEMQREVASSPRLAAAGLRVRMGVHTGFVLPAADGFVGLDLHLAARISGAGHGGQVLLSGDTVRCLTPGSLPGGVSLRRIGDVALRDIQRTQDLYQLVIEGLLSDFPPLRGVVSPKSNLPAEVSRLVGRDVEIRAVTDLVRSPDARMITLVGPGGVGKTRLARAVATNLTAFFADGVCYVDLVEAGDVRGLQRAIRRALSPEIHEAAGPLAQQLTGKQLLLVLDNFEHLPAEAARHVSRLLSEHEGLRVLATSRAPLAIHGEHIFKVPPLALPAGLPLARPADLEQFAASELFLERLQDADPTIVLGPADVAAVAEICRHVDGLPLAIEIAAARCLSLPPKEVARQILHGPAFLDHEGPVDASERHRSLRSVVSWSYRLLPGPDRALFRALGVFAGGFTPEAAEAVHGTSAADRLRHLVAGSLVARQPGTGTRFALLETIRAFAVEELKATGEEEAVRDRHLLHFVEEGQRLGSRLMGERQFAALTALEQETENIRAALEWAFTTPGRALLGLRMAVALHRYWAQRMPDEGPERLVALLEAAGDVDIALRAEAMVAIGVLATYSGRAAQAITAFEECIQLCRPRGGPVTALGLALSFAAAARWSTDTSGARALAREAVEVLERGGGPTWHRGIAWGNLGAIATWDGDHAEAEAASRRAIDLLLSAGDRWMAAAPARWLSQDALQRGDHAGAQAWLEQALAIAHSVGDVGATGRALEGMGRVALSAGDFDGAASALRESLRLGRESGRLTVIWALDAVGVWNAKLGRWEEAVAILAAADHALKQAGQTLEPYHRAEHDGCLARASEALGPSVFEACGMRGRLMNLREAVDYALAGL